MTRHFRTLDAMRGIAALAVVVMHAGALFSGDLFPRGYLAVDLFFALSGFVIAHAYGHRLESGMSAGRFLMLRLVRLYPLYILGVVLGVAVYFGERLHGGVPFPPAPDLAVALASSAVMLPTPVAIESSHWISPFNIPGWSLVFEVGANLFLALVWTRLSGRLLALLILVSGLLLVAQYLLVGDVDVGARWTNAAYGIPRTAFSFLLGVALERLPRPAERRSDLALLLPLGLAASFLPGTDHGFGYDVMCTFLLFPTLVYAGAVIEPRSGERLFAFLGLVSFAIYALHNPLLPVANTVLAHLAPSPGVFRFLCAVGFVVMLVLFAWLADRFYDGPVRRRLGRRFALPRTAAA
jgi:peptidoglycan/LPS O-acetylase OafA/YrhL